MAVKVLDPVKAAQDPGSVAGLANEARILSRVQHPNIVQARHFRRISDVALGDTWILVMELVRGQSLRRVLRHDRNKLEPLPISAPLLVMSEIADGLHFAHRLRDAEGHHVGLVHRDLKPANISVTTEGRVKILDFGIAWAKRRLGTATGGGITKGTPLYMSPEQLHGERLDGRSDLYALGAITFEFLTGAEYVRVEEGLDGSPLDAAMKVDFVDREPELVWALKHRYGLGDGKAKTKLVALLRALLARNPSDRPRTGGEVFDALEGLWELHRPSAGRGALRKWVESRAALDQGSLDPETAATAPTSDIPARPKVTETLLLSRGTVAEDDDDADSSLDALSLSAVEPVEVVHKIGETSAVVRAITDEDIEEAKKGDAEEAPEKEGKGKWWKKG